MKSHAGHTDHIHSLGKVRQLADEIPAISRIRVRVRDLQACARCFMPLEQGHWHHRRSRSIRDTHRHCACNGVWLCAHDHQWVHAHPFEARQVGLIVSRHTAQPGTVPFRRGDGAWILPDCAGDKKIVEANDIAEAIEKFTS